MPNNISFGVKLIAVVVLIRLLTDLVPVRRGTFLLDENTPDTGGVADKKHRAVIQIEPDTGNIEAFDFIIMEQDTPSIAVRLRWGGMHFLEKTKIQRFLLTSFQYLDDLYPCSRMANNLNFGNCY